MMAMLYLLTTLLLFVAALFGPWWTIAPVCLVLSCILSKRGAHAFWSTFLAGFTVWALFISYSIFTTNHLLADRMAQLFRLPGYAVLAAASSLVGALAAGLSGLTGWRLSRLFRKPAVVTEKPGRHRFVMPEFQPYTSSPSHN